MLAYWSCIKLEMGNCIGTAFALSDKRDEEDHQGKMSSGPVSGLCNGPLPLAALLKQQHSLKVGERVKIVVNKEQLQLLMESMVIQSMRNRGRKWRPCLATIPEL